MKYCVEVDTYYNGIVKVIVEAFNHSEAKEIGLAQARAQMEVKHLDSSECQVVFCTELSD